MFGLGVLPDLGIKKAPKQGEVCFEALN